MKKGKKIFLWTAGVLVVILVYFQIISGRIIILHHEVMINTSPEKVWAVLNNIEEVGKYNPQVAEAKCISTEHEGLGASRQCTMKDGSKIKEKVILVEPNRAVSMELFESDWPVQNMKWRTAVEPKDNGTLVTQKLEYQVKYGA